MSYPSSSFDHVFEGFGVGLTITRVGVDLGPNRPGERPSRLSEVLPVDAWPAAQKALAVELRQWLKQYDFQGLNVDLHEHSEVDTRLGDETSRE